MSMGTPRDDERLSDMRYLVLLLRLLVDKEDRILCGEVSGAEIGAERWVRFRGADGLQGAIQKSISAQTESC
jgi:hypothetical protein